MEILIVLLTASSAGGFLSIGAAANARLRRSLRSPVAAATVNFMVGFGTLTLLLVLGVLGPVDLSRLAQVPWWAFLGGLLGAVFVTLNTLVVPQLGLTTTTLAVVCSQMTMSLLVDQWGWFGLTPQPISASRAIAIVLLLVAVALTQLDRPTKPAIASSLPDSPPDPRSETFRDR